MEFSREVGWTLEEVDCHLGHVTVKGTPVIQTTVRHILVNRAWVKEELKGNRGGRVDQQGEDRVSASRKTFALLLPLLADDLVEVPRRSHGCNKELSGATSFEWLQLVAHPMGRTLILVELTMRNPLELQLCFD